MGCCIDFSPKIKQEKKIRCENYRGKKVIGQIKKIKKQSVLYIASQLLYIFSQQLKHKKNPPPAQQEILE